MNIEQHRILFGLVKRAWNEDQLQEMKEEF